MSLATPSGSVATPVAEKTSLAGAIRRLRSAQVEPWSGSLGGRSLAGAHGALAPDPH